MRIEDYSPYWQITVSTLTVRVLEASYFEIPSQIQRDADSCVLVAIDDEEEVAGFVRGGLLSKDGLKDFLEHRLLEVPEDLKKADTEGALGVIQTVRFNEVSLQPKSGQSQRD